MVLFGFIFFVSVFALVVLQKLDIECERPARKRAAKLSRGEKRSGFPADSMALNQV